jgi:hypothetical protein
LNDGLFNLNRSFLQRAVGRRDENVQAGQFEKITDQPNAARPQKRNHEVGSKRQPVQKGRAGRRFEEGDHLRVRVDGIFALEPVLKRGAGNADFPRDVPQASPVLSRFALRQEGGDLLSGFRGLAA